MATEHISQIIWNSAAASFAAPFQRSGSGYAATAKGAWHAQLLQSSALSTPSSANARFQLDPMGASLQQAGGIGSQAQSIQGQAQNSPFGSTSQVTGFDSSGQSNSFLAESSVDYSTAGSGVGGGADSSPAAVSSLGESSAKSRTGSDAGSSSNIHNQSANSQSTTSSAGQSNSTDDTGTSSMHGEGGSSNSSAESDHQSDRHGSESDADGRARDSEQNLHQSGEADDITAGISSSRASSTSSGSTPQNGIAVKSVGSVASSTPQSGGNNSNASTQTAGHAHQAENAQSKSTARALQSPTNSHSKNSNPKQPSPGGSTRNTSSTSSTNSSSVTGARGAASQTTAPTFVRSIMSLTHLNGGAMTMKLAPESLGSLRVQMTVNQGNVSVQFHTATPEASALIRESFQSLRTSLESHGLRMEQLTIQPMSREIGGSAGSNDDSNSPQHHSQGKQSEGFFHWSRKDQRGGNQSHNQSGSPQSESNSSRFLNGLNIQMEDELTQSVVNR